METKEQLKEKYSLYEIPNYSKHGVTKDGKVFTYQCRVHNGRWKHVTINKTGYASMHLMNDNGKQENLGLHRIIALAFIPNPENKAQVNHKDGNKLNNSIDNLEWMTKSENQYHAIKTGLWKPTDKLRKSAAKNGRGRRLLNDEQVRDIRNNYIKSHKMKQSNKGLIYFSKKYSVDISVIHNIVKGKTYLDVI